MKRKLYLVGIFLLPAVLMLTSQPVMDFEHALGGTVDDNGNAVVQTNDKGYVAAGAAYSSDGDLSANYGETDYWVVKMDSTGALVWQKNYGGSGTDEAASVIQTFDGGYLAGGTSASSDHDVTAPHGNFDFWIVKTDSAGTIIWEKSLGGSGSDNLACLIQTADSGYVAAGLTYSSDGDVAANQGSADYWVVRMDNAGNILWENTYGGSAFDQANSIVETPGGDFVIAGASNSADGDVSAPRGSYDFWMVKTDANGNLLWEQSYGGTGIDWANDICMRRDTTFVIAGSANKNDGDVSVFYGGEYDVWLIAIDIDGTLLWENTFGGSHDDRCYALDTTYDRGVVLGAVTASSDHDVSRNMGGYDYWMVKVDNAGTMVWESTFGGSTTDWTAAVHTTFDGGIVAGGTSGSTNGDVTGVHGTYGASDMWVVKFAPWHLSYVWTGAADTSWHNAANWSSGSVPAGSNDVIIDSVLNMPAVTSNTGCGTIILKPGAALTIDNGDTLTVNGDVVWESNIDQAASLIDEGKLDVSGKARASLYLAGDRSHYVSSSVTNATADVFTYAELKRYDELSQSWIGLSAGDPMTPSKGYEEAYNDTLDHTVMFTGTFNTGSQAVAVTNSNTGDPAVDGWNLVGNPYPSVVDWDAPAGWTKTNIDNTVYYWNGTQYATYNGTTKASTNGGTRYIPAMQGVFVKCNDPAGGTFGVNDAVRVHTQQAYWKKSLYDDRLTLQVQGNGYTDETALLFVGDTAAAFNGNYDAYKLFGIQEAPQLFSYACSDSVKAAINSLEVLVSDTSVPIGCSMSSAGTYTLKASGLYTFTNTDIYLEDTYADSLTDLTQHDTYAFDHDPAAGDRTFVLHFYPLTTGINKKQIEAHVFYSDRHMHIVRKQEPAKQAVIQIFDLSGRVVRQIPCHAQHMAIPFDRPEGLYILRITDGTTNCVKKIWVH